ncbi:unnamed protein product, partial [Sphacelaria rigidula]
FSNRRAHRSASVLQISARFHPDVVCAPIAICFWLRAADRRTEKDRGKEMKSGVEVMIFIGGVTTSVKSPDEPTTPFAQPRFVSHGAPMITARRVSGARGTPRNLSG